MNSNNKKGIPPTKRKELFQWRKEQTVYQVYPRSFCDSNGDGIGDLKGILSKLDYLKDLVINHTSDEHEWFQRSRQNKENPYWDYYIWREGKGKSPPNDWSSFFSGSAWEKDSLTDQYYLHLFSKRQPNLNWKNPKVREEIHSILRFWLEMGIAGFRCDVINVIYKTALSDGKRRLILSGREHYLSQQGCHQILKAFRNEIFSHYDCFTVGETVFVTTKMAKNCAMKIEVNWIWFFLLSTWMSTASTTNGIPFLYQGQEIGMTNGDFKSIQEFQDVETLSINRLMQKLHFLPSLAWTILKKSSRDNAPMQWDSQKGAGFTYGIPWLKINSNHKVINIEEQTIRKDSLLSTYKNLISIRERYPALLRGSFSRIKSAPKIFAYIRSYKDQSILVLLNSSKQKKEIR